ncbi:hypothetical protein PMZ80_000222 [Knufia obscura]|uniref:MYND-type domain-containing protein n=1 Tax=Knufia obscura TaxID=1635080 RepID=A0ABR0S0U7_9EURO|nr:hypothetical protein PMZ80_000222 [Knufia obscura]
MGRWGYTMFQGDSDLDIVSEFDDEVGVSIHEKPEKLKEAREKLDAGLGAELMKKCREKEKGYHELMFEDPRYHTIILGAYMMQVGAKIAPDDRAHLAEIFPKIPSRAGYAMPMGDDGFRDPGKAQFKAALELYVDGQPRNFFDASCYNCGKTNADLDPAKLKTCSRCTQSSKSSFYCNQECQKENWKSHKQICKPLMQGRGGLRMLNV